MVDLPYWAFIAYIQVMIFSILVAVIFFVLFRKQKKLLKLANTNLKEEVSTNKIKLYFDMEVKITRGQHDKIQQKTKLTTDEKISASLLLFRADLLEFESVYTDKDVSATEYWKVLLDHYKSILKSHDLMGSFESKFSEEHEDVHALFENQEKEMNDLLEEADQLAKDDEQVLNISAKLHKLANSHRELSGCVFVLEDENRFLREQIATLLNEVN